jgi:hypothetical protein
MYFMNRTRNETLLAHGRDGGTKPFSLGRGRWPKPWWEGNVLLLTVLENTRPYLTAYTCRTKYPSAYFNRGQGEQMMKLLITFIFSTILLLRRHSVFKHPTQPNRATIHTVRTVHCNPTYTLHGVASLVTSPWFGTQVTRLIHANCGYGIIHWPYTAVVRL